MRVFVNPNNRKNDLLGDNIFIFVPRCESFFQETGFKYIKFPSTDAMQKEKGFLTDLKWLAR